MRGRKLRAAGAGALLALATVAALGQAPASDTPYTVVSKEGRRPLPVRTVGGQEMFSLDELARLFGFTVREDALAGGLTVQTSNQSVVLTPGQALASVGGRLVSLSGAPVREGRTWLVPVDVVPRALAPAMGIRLELRRPSRLIVAGDVRVPRVGGAIEALGASARLTLEVAPATPHTIAQDGSRLVIRFEAEGLDATLPVSTTPEIVRAVRPGDAPASLVVDLGPRFASYKASDMPGDRGSVRLVIDLVAPTTGATPAPSAPATPAAPETPLLDLPPAGALRTIVIDAGHGGEEDGARGPGGALEKNVTLSVARRLKAALEARLGVRVILTRDADQTVGLDERAALANNNKADVFVSLHVNASVRSTASGAEVFYLSLAEYGDQAERVARGESEAVPVFGGGVRDIEVILWEMAQARYIEQSATLAQLVESSLRERVQMSPRAIQQAPFRVLVGANMPAVLIELGFITNPDQERLLTSEGFQGSLVQALIESLIRFRDSRTTQRTGAAAPPRPGGATH